MCPMLQKIFREFILCMGYKVSQTLSIHYVSAAWLHKCQGTFSANATYWKMFLSHKCPIPQAPVVPLSFYWVFILLPLRIIRRCWASVLLVLRLWVCYRIVILNAKHPLANNKRGNRKTLNIDNTIADILESDEPGNSTHIHMLSSSLCIRQIILCLWEKQNLLTTDLLLS